MERVGDPYKEKTDSTHFVYVLQLDTLKSIFTKSLTAANANSVKLTIRNSYKNRSSDDPLRAMDTYPFILRGIHSLSFFSGLTKDALRPTETVDKVNFPLLTRQTKIAFLAITPFFTTNFNTVPLRHNSSTWHSFLLWWAMIYHNFLKCLTSGNWQFQGHVYKFLSPSLQRYGAFTVDGVDENLNFEVSFENGQLYLFLNVDNDILTAERYRVLENYCNEKLSMIQEIRKANGPGYNGIELNFEKIPAHQLVNRNSKTLAHIIGRTFSEMFGKATTSSRVIV